MTPCVLRVSVSLWLTVVILICSSFPEATRVAGPCSADSRSPQHRHAAAHRLDSRDDGGRQRASDDVRVGGGSDRGAVLRGDAVRPAAPAPRPQRSLRALEGPRRADSLRGLVGRRAGAAGRAAEAARAGQRPRRASDAAPAVCRRRHRVARPGAGRRPRHRAQRQAHQVRLPHLRADGRRRDGRGLGLGGRRKRHALWHRQPRRHHRRQPPGAEPPDHLAARPRRAGAPLERASAGTRCRSTATTSPRSSTRWPRPAPPRAARR